MIEMMSEMQGPYQTQPPFMNSLRFQNINFEGQIGLGLIF